MVAGIAAGIAVSACAVIVETEEGGLEAYGLAVMHGEEDALGSRRVTVRNIGATVLATEDGWGLAMGWSRVSRTWFADLGPALQGCTPSYATLSDGVWREVAQSVVHVGLRMTDCRTGGAGSTVRNWGVGLFSDAGSSTTLAVGYVDRHRVAIGPDSAIANAVPPRQ